MWEFLNTDRWTMLGKAPRGRRDVVVPLRRPPKYEILMPQIAAMAAAGPAIDLIAGAQGPVPRWCATRPNFTARACGHQAASTAAAGSALLASQPCRSTRS